MAIFGKKQNTASEKKTAQYKNVNVDRPVEDVLIKPRITEKAAYGGEKGVYVFNVAPDAIKSEISRAVRKMYKVTPRQVNIARVPSKQVKRRGIAGRRPGGKKAYVYLKEGEKIELM